MVKFFISIKDFLRSVRPGIKNLIHWLPIVWKDRDWDHDFILEALKFKIKKTADYIESKKRFVGWETEVKYMRISIELISRIQEDYYQAECFPYRDLELVKSGDGYVIETTRDDSQIYLAKYPLDLKRAMKHPDTQAFFKEGSSHFLGVSRYRHMKSRKLLFKILEERIERWWD
jgi:hypothetical protein